MMILFAGIGVTILLDICAIAVVLAAVYLYVYVIFELGTGIISWRRAICQTAQTLESITNPWMEHYTGILPIAEHSRQTPGS